MLLPSWAHAADTVPFSISLTQQFPRHLGHHRIDLAQKPPPAAIRPHKLPVLPLHIIIMNKVIPQRPHYRRGIVHGSFQPGHPPHIMQVGQRLAQEVGLRVQCRRLGSERPKLAKGQSAHIHQRHTCRERLPHCTFGDGSPEPASRCVHALPRPCTPPPGTRVSVSPQRSLRRPGHANGLGSGG